MKILFFLFVFLTANLTISDIFAEKIDELDSIQISIPQLDEIRMELRKNNETSENWNRISYGVSLTAIIAAAITASFVMRQAKVMEKELSYKLQPWIIINGVRPHQIILQHGRSLLYDEWHNRQTEIPVSVRFKFTIINTGMDVARNIKRIVHVSDQQFTREVFESLHEYSTPVLAPNRHYDITFDVGWDRYVQLEQDNLFVGLSISYDGPKGRKYSGEIEGIRSGANYILDSWYD
jgi:hypothetical protein